MNHGDEISHPCGLIAVCPESPPIDLPHELSDPLLFGVCAHNPPLLHHEALGKREQMEIHPQTMWDTEAP